MTSFLNGDGQKLRKETGDGVSTCNVTIKGVSKMSILKCCGGEGVVYFDQCFGAADPKRCSKYAISTFLMVKS